MPNVVIHLVSAGFSVACSSRRPVGGLLALDLKGFHAIVKAEQNACKRCLPEYQRRLAAVRARRAAA